MMQFLSGKKTYIVAIAIGLITFAYYAGLLTKEQFETIQSLLVAAGAATLRMAIGGNGK